MTIKDELNQIHQYAIEGRAKKAHSLLLALEKRNKLSERERLMIQIEKLHVLDYLGQLEKMLELAPDVVKDAKEVGDVILTIKALIKYTNVLWLLRQPFKSLEIVQEVEELLKIVSNSLISEKETLKAWLLYNKSRIYSNWLSDYSSAMIYAQEGLRLFQTHNIPDGQAYIGDVIAEIYVGLGQKDKAYKLYKANIELFQEAKDKWGIAHTYWRLGDLLIFKGELGQAYEYLEKGKLISEKIDHQESLAHTLGSLGRLFIQKGELDLALSCYKRSMDIYKLHNRQWFIASSLDKLGDIFYIKGELSGALKYFQKALNIFENISSSSRFISYYKIGKIRHAQGDFSTAAELYLQYLNNVEKMKSLVYPFNGHQYLTMYNLIKLYIEIQDFERANYYLKELEHLNSQKSNDWIQQAYSLGFAALLKSQNRSIPKANAQVLYKQLAEAQIIDFELTIDAYLNLIALLIEEYTRYENEEALSDAYNWLTKLVYIAKEKNSFSVLAESYLLQSKLSVIDLNIEKSYQLLEKALTICEEKGLKRLANIISKEKLLLADHRSIKETIKTLDSPDLTSLNETMEMANFLALVDRMIHNRFYLKEKDLLQGLQKKDIKIGVCFGSFSDKGWEIHIVTKECPVKKGQIRSIFEYTGVLYQYGELKSLYGPFPLPLLSKTKQTEWHYLSYGTKLKDEHITDTRLVNQGGNVPAIFLLIYPKQLDSLMLISKQNIVEYLNSLAKKATISNVTEVQLLEMEQILFNNISSEYQVNPI